MGVEPGTDDLWDRTTAPQSAYRRRDAFVGFLVLVIGLVIVFGLPLALL